MSNTSKNSFLAFYNKAKGVKSLQDMRRILTEFFPFNERKSIGSLDDYKVRQLFCSLRAQGELLGEQRGLVLEAYPYNTSFYPKDFSTLSLHDKILASNSPHTYVQSTNNTLFVSRDNPFTFNSVYYILQRIKRRSKIEAISFEMDVSKQGLLDSSYDDNKRTSIHDLGPFALLVNYGLEECIKSYAVDNFDLTPNERAHYSATHLKRLSQSHSFMAHIGSKSQADRIIKVING
jgi:hypothetical protein